jgi:hypothetical protein
MLEDKAFQEQIQQIGELIGKLDGTADPDLRACARDLVRLILDLHGAGLDRVMHLVSQAGEVGEHLKERFDRDDLVRSLLLLHGLHPLDFEARVRRAVDHANASLQLHGVRGELLSLGDGVVRIRLSGGKGCTATKAKADLEDAIYAAAPDLASLVVEVEAETGSSAFLPLTSLFNHPVTVQRGSDRP